MAGYALSPSIKGIKINTLIYYKEGITNAQLFES